MSLDQNLFTLNIQQREGSPFIVELVDPSGTRHYRKELSQNVGGPYEFNVFEPLYDSLLATVTAPSASSKHKTIELHNPSVPVELKHTGTFTFRWTFKWEEHEFEWKREECFLIRKPDPPVLVAITKEPPGRIKTKAVQILDYNLKRFDMDDRKGLEIVMLSALLSFQDYNDELHGASTTPPILGTPAIKSRDASPPPPELPPKPKRSGVELVAEMQKGELGEVTVESEGGIQDYAQYCTNLLENDEILFVVLRSSSATTVPKVLDVAHQTKRIRHKAGMDDELHQYVQYDTERMTGPSGKKGPRIIKLDDDAEEKDRYKPPESLTVHLSKIPLPELQPKVKSKDKGKETERVSEEAGTKGSGKGKGKEKGESGKERKRREKEEEKERDRERKEQQRREKQNQNDKGKSRARSLDRDDRGTASNRLAKPISHIPPHQAHPNQPSPSPSQLNNPAIYAAPIPRPPARPTLYPQPPQGHYPTFPPGAGQIQRPVSAYGQYLGPPQPPLQNRSQSPTSMVNGLLGKLKSW